MTLARLSFPAAITSLAALATIAAIATRVSNGAADAAAAADSFSVDPVHSSLVFRIRYADVSDFYGRFNQFGGTFELDESDLSKARFDITVKAESVDSGNEKRDGHLRTPDFFNAKQHPEIRFVSRRVEADGKRLKVTGDLTLRGVTREITVEAKYNGQKKGPRGGTRAGFDGSFTIQRKDFGITFGEGMLGDEVTVILGLNGLKS